MVRHAKSKNVARKISPTKILSRANRRTKVMKTGFERQRHNLRRSKDLRATTTHGSRKDFAQRCVGQKIFERRQYLLRAKTFCATTILRREKTFAQRHTYIAQKFLCDTSIVVIAQNLFFLFF